jgi:cell wall-associated NlpC family hydrolase
VRIGLVSALAVAAALAHAAAATADGYAELVTPDGKTTFSAVGPSFDYPGDGSVLHVGSARLVDGTVVLRDVSLYDGTVRAGSVAVPLAGRASRVSGLEVNGRRVDAHANTLVLLGGGSYLLAEQAAVDASGAIGLVALRLVLNDAQHRVPPGSQLLVGLPSPPRTRSATTTATTRHARVGVLGLPLAEPAGWHALALPEPIPVPAVSTRGARAAALAMRYLGVPYVWAGASPDVGFDCSGLVMYVYGRLGVTLAHFSGAQWNQGTRVFPDDLQPGDLVFFNMGALGPGHVGIYIGGHRFVHAPHAGDVVKISSLDDARYGLRYVGAVRPYEP